MKDTLSHGATNWREGRRFRAFELHQKGWRQKDIAEALGVSKGAVSQWVKRAREGGIEALRHRKSPGAPPRLTWEQRARLLQLLAQGAQSFSFQGDLWTQPGVAEVIRREFGVSYDPSQVGRILKQCGLSLQKPLRRAIQPDETAIQHWKEQRWPVLKKRRSQRIVPSCGWTNLGSISCLRWLAPGLPSERPPSSGTSFLGSISRPSVALPWRDGFIS